MRSESEREEVQTVRRRIIELLEEGPVDIRDISQVVGIMEKEVPDHLEHIFRTVARQKKKLVFIPYECANCGFIFRERRKFSRPGRCPECKGTHIHPAMFQIE